MSEPTVTLRGTDRHRKLGFGGEKSSAHASRTIMLEELEIVFAKVSIDSTRESVRSAIVDENILGKRSVKTRELTFRHLADLYGLDPIQPVFRGLAYFWRRDPEAHGILALLCAFARDRVLEVSSNFILSTPEGSRVSREALEAHIESVYPHRFSPATLKSTAQNVNSSWTQSGHLSGRVHKSRSHPSATPGSAAYSVFLGYLQGLRGQGLFHSGFTQLLDYSADRALSLAQDAAQKGWIKLNQIGDVIEVDFPNLLTETDRELLREQN